MEAAFILLNEVGGCGSLKESFFHFFKSSKKVIYWCFIVKTLTEETMTN